jgi:hypothetical protein
MDDNENFLSRWSRRKREAAVVDTGPTKALPAGGTPEASVVPAAPATPAAAPPLPSIESLTPESDFLPFMKPDVDGGLRNQALKTLFQDPHFNKMDMLDVYVDDYSKPDPLPEGWLAKLKQMDRLGHYQEPVEEGAQIPEGKEAGAPVEEEKIAMEQEVGDVTATPIADTDSGVGKVPEIGESDPRRPAPA